MSSNTVYILALRHAHRTVIDAKDDNGLSEKGLGQASETADKILSKWGPERHWKLYSSPKRRCQETLYKLEKSLNTQAEVRIELDEQNTTEKSSDMKKRIIRILKEIDGTPGSYIFCSHGDWIPMLQTMLTGSSDIIYQADGILFSRGSAHENWQCEYVKLGGDTYD